MTICGMFTNVDTMVTTTQLLMFEVRIPSVSCREHGNPTAVQEQGTAVASNSTNTSGLLFLCYYWQMVFITY